MLTILRKVCTIQEVNWDFKMIENPQNMYVMKTCARVLLLEAAISLRSELSMTLFVP